VVNYSIKIQNLFKTFDKLPVIDDLTLEIEKEGIFGLLGKNGAGKTTLLGMLMGLITPTSGKISIFGMNLQKQKYKILNILNFQSPYFDLPKKMTVKQNLIFYSRLYSVKNIEENLLKLSFELKLDPLLNKSFGSLSAGQKTRVSLCKSLLNKPKLLLLDEPTSSLDPETSIFVRNYLIKYQRDNNASILLASHNLSEIESMCSSVIILRLGKIIAQGKLSDLLKKKNYSSVEELFLGEG